MSFWDGKLFRLYIIMQYQCRQLNSKGTIGILVAVVCLMLSGVAGAESPTGEAELRKLVELNHLAAKNVYSAPDKALQYTAEAVEQAVKLQNHQEQSVALLQRGLAYLQLGNLPEVQKNLEASLAAAQQAGFLQGQGDAYNFLGTYFWEVGMYDQAMKNYLKALEIRTDLGERIRMSKTISNLGQVNRKIGNYEQALEHFRQSLELKGSDDATGRSNTLTNMSLVYKETMEYEQALQLMEQALAVATKAKYIQGQAFARRSMGEVQLAMNRLPEALDNLQQSAQLYEKVSYFKGQALAYYSIGRIYEEQGKSMLAMENYDKALLIADNIGQKRLQGDIYYHSAKVAKTEGKQELAHEYYEKSLQIAQDIGKEEIKQRILLQQISLEAERMQHEMDLLKQQAEVKSFDARNREKLLFAAGISLFFFGIAALYFHLQLLEKRKKEQELLAVTHRLEETTKRLNQLVETDHLTTIANRRQFDCKYSEKYYQLRKEPGILSVIMIDFDLFKQYNDLYGHQRGDDCLKEVAEALKTIDFGANSFLARYGGEEFVIVAEEGLKRSLELSEQARQIIEQLNLTHSGSPFGRVTCSFGVATASDLEKSSPEILLKMADKALYLAKAKGRNCVATLQEAWKEQFTGS